MATPPAPDIGRQPKIVTISSCSYRITPLAPRAGSRVLFRVLKSLGEPLAALLSGAGIELPGHEDDDGNPKRVGWQEILHSSIARQAMAGRLISAVGDMDADDVAQLSDDLTVGQVEVQEGKAWIGLATGDMVDSYLPTVWAYVQLVKEALGMLLLPTSAADDTSDGS